MLRKPIIAVTSAAFLAIAGSALTGGSASATGYGTGYHGGVIGKSMQQRHWRPRWRAPSHRFCRPVYEQIKIWRPNRGWIWKTVYVGQRCWPAPRYRRHW